MNIKAKDYFKMLANRIQQDIKRIDNTHHNQVWFVPGIQDWLNMQKSIHKIYLVNSQDRIK